MKVAVDATRPGLPGGCQPARMRALLEASEARFRIFSRAPLPGLPARLAPRALGGLPAQLWMLAEARRWGAELVLTDERAAALAPPSLRSVVRLDPGSPVFARPVPGDLPARWLGRFGLRRAWRLVVPGPAMESWLPRGEDPRLRVVPPGLDPLPTPRSPPPLGLPAAYAVLTGRGEGAWEAARRLLARLLGGAPGFLVLLLPGPVPARARDALGALAGRCAWLPDLDRARRVALLAGARAVVSLAARALDAVALDAAALGAPLVLPRRGPLTGMGAAGTVDLFDLPALHRLHRDIFAAPAPVLGTPGLTPGWEAAAAALAAVLAEQRG